MRRSSSGPRLTSQWPDPACSGLVEHEFESLAVGFRDQLVGVLTIGEAEIGAIPGEGFTGDVEADVAELDRFGEWAVIPVNDESGTGSLGAEGPLQS